MKLSVVFPSVMYREGRVGVKKLMSGIEEIGYDELDVFDHVVMGFPTKHRQAPVYDPKMPIMEAVTMLSFAAAVTEHIKLGTGVMVLPQRQIALVAKQVSSLDTLSNGRIRLGVGIGWQRSEYEALNENFRTRGRRLEEGVALLRQYWEDEHVNFSGQYYQVEEIAMEPKPPQRGAIPIWIGGTKERALKRIARIADGWMAMTAPGDPPIQEVLPRFKDLLEENGKDPATYPMQMSLSPGAIDKDKRKRFYNDMDLLVARVCELRDLGFSDTSIDCVPLFQLGFRSSDALLEQLAKIYEALAPELSD